METRARLSYSRISPRKVRLVASLVRRLQVEDAINTLRFVPKRGARILAKVLKSAVANAEQNPQIKDIDRLYVREILIDGGPTLKRFRTAPMGRSMRVRKRTSHITVILDEREG